MLRIKIENINDIMEAAGIIIKMSAKTEDAEVWHPALVNGATYTRYTIREWDEIHSHEPLHMSVRVTTPYKVTVVKDIWQTQEMHANYNEAFEIRLELIVARALNRLIGRNPAIIDIDVDWDSLIPVVVDVEKRPRRRRGPRQPRH